MTFDRMSRRQVLSGLAATLPLLSTRLSAAESFAGRSLVTSGFGGSTMDIIQ
jgi:putative spermidine/putrescine transport system substrate-binding protein